MRRSATPSNSASGLSFVRVGLGLVLIGALPSTAPGCTKGRADAQPESKEASKEASKATAEAPTSAGASPSPDGERPHMSREALREYEAELREGSNSYTRKGKSEACAGDASAAAQAFDAFIAPLETHCQPPPGDRLGDFENELRSNADADDPVWTGPDAQALRGCRARAELLLAAPRLDQVCSPHRPVHSPLSDAPFDRFKRISAAMDVIALDLHDRFAAGDAVAAFGLGLRAIEAGQVLTRGRVDLLDAAMGVALPVLPIARLRVELQALRARPAITVEQARSMAERIDALIAAEPVADDILVGEHISMSLRTWSAIDNPKDPVVVAAHRDMNSAPPSEAGVLAELLPGAGAEALADPFALMWSAGVHATESQRALCEGQSLRVCHQRGSEWAREIQERIMSASTLERLGTPPEVQIYDSVISTMAMVTPPLHGRGLSLAHLRLVAELLARPGCPDPASFDAAPWAELRRTPFAAEPLSLRLEGRALVIEASDDDSGDPWTVFCE